MRARAPARRLRRSLMILGLAAIGGSAALVENNPAGLLATNQCSRVARVLSVDSCTVDRADSNSRLAATL